VAAALVLPACSDSDGEATQQATTTVGIVAPTVIETTAVPATDAPTTAPPTTAVQIGALPAPSGDAFYLPPDPLPPGEPGDIIWAEPLEQVPEGTQGWRILYRSESVKGDPIAVSGMVFAPDPLPGGGPLPILAAAHGTTGLADRCAPSKLAETEENSVETTGLPAELLSSYVVTATDYEGLGTPGVHPYVVGLSEARSVLDSIRAAQRLPGIGTDATSKSQVWGHSQGGGAALVTAELAPTYAPDANLVGAVAGAPAAELKLLGSALRTSPYFGYVFMASAGFEAAYSEIDLSQVLTPAGLEAAAAAAEQCGGETVEAYQGKDPNLYLNADPATVEPYGSLLEENSPGVRATSVPIFMYHGEADEQIPVIASQLVLDRYCKNGTTALRKTYPGATHGSVVPLALPEIQQYLADRLAGAPAPSSC